MKLAIVGSRNWTNQSPIYNALQELKPTLVISGGALGVDTIAILAADYFNIPTKVFKPDWVKYGKKAGAVRNAEMVKECDKLIAFWDGQSKGTKISIDLATKARKLLRVETEPKK